jgi:hypothetical protein
MTELLDQQSGEVVGEFSDYDQLVEALRNRAAAVGLNYLLIDELAGLSSGYTGHILGPMRKRHLSVASLIAIAKALGVKSIIAPRLGRA